MKILLIEDNIFMGELIQKMLKLKKYQVHWLKSGIEVMEYLSDTSYDILLVDWMLPINEPYFEKVKENIKN